MSGHLSIDGVTPARIERPTTAEAVAEVIRETDASGAWVLPYGGATAMSGANPVDAIPVALDLSGISGVVEYTPADLTISVGAGTRWGELQDVLAAEGQTIPLDIPFPRQATVGGVVATGYAGPRRLRDGTLKDLLLGATYVRGDGLVAKAGGMVVKNVSGFEVPRLLHGSWGSLAVISSVNLKVIPLHDHEITIQSDQADTLATAGRVLALTRSRSAIAAATVDGTLEAASASIRLAGREAPTQVLAEEIRSEQGFSWGERIDGRDVSSAWWQEREDRLATDVQDQVVIEIGCQPSQVVQMLDKLRVAMPDAASVRVHVSPGTGAILVGFVARVMTLDTWVRVWLEHELGATARFVVVSAPREWRAARDVWFIPPGPRSIMQSLKQRFDPNDVLNRGRLWTTPAVART